MRAWEPAHRRRCIGDCIPFIGNFRLECPNFGCCRSMHHSCTIMRVTCVSSEVSLPSPLLSPPFVASSLPQFSGARNPARYHNRTFTHMPKLSSTMHENSCADLGMVHLTLTATKARVSMLNARMQGAPNLHSTRAHVCVLICNPAQARGRGKASSLAFRASASAPMCVDERITDVQTLQDSRTATLPLSRM